jgi:hypothetical protein
MSERRFFRFRMMTRKQDLNRRPIFRFLLARMKRLTAAEPPTKKMYG